MQKFELKETARLLEKCAVRQPARMPAARMRLTSPAREQSGSQRPEAWRPPHRKSESRF